MDLSQIRADLERISFDVDAVLRLQQELPLVLNKFEEFQNEKLVAATAEKQIENVIVAANIEFENAEIEVLEFVEEIEPVFPE